MAATTETELVNLAALLGEYNRLAIQVGFLKKSPLASYPVEQQKIFGMEFRLLELEEQLYGKIH